MNQKKLMFLALCTILLLSNFLPIENIVLNIRNPFAAAGNLHITLETVCKDITFVASDETNGVLLKVRLTDMTGKPIANTWILNTITKGHGSLFPKASVTDISGECFVKYIPLTLNKSQIQLMGSHIMIKSAVKNTSVSSTLGFELTDVPVVLIHGYQETVALLSNMVNFLSEKGIKVSSFDYNSKKGIQEGSDKLTEHLQTMQKTYAQEGILINRFDLVSHSMGGLVARHYTTQTAYLNYNNVRKIIFISVPQKGTPWAPIGAKYLDDQGVLDLIPDGSYFTKIFPASINQGLNPTIQTANILAQYDEVVDEESAGLEEWGIRTEIYNVGKKTTILDSLMSGNIMEAPNHQGILYNKTVFDNISQKLDSSLHFPDHR